MGSSSTVGTSSTFLSNTRERASNFGACRLRISSAPAINTGDIPDTLDHTTENSSGGLWEPHTMLGCNTALPLRSRHCPLVSCVIH